MMGRLLEVINGAAVTPELLSMVLLAIYLCKESKRRGLRRLDWFRLPPSMNLVLAIFVFDSGVLIRSLAAWARRHFHLSSSTDPGFAIVILVGGALIVVGSLCKVRALTRPDHGDGPWLLAAISTGFAVLVLLLLP